MAERPEVHEGSGNVFADLGLPDADILLIKADAVVHIRWAMEAEGLSQRAAAARMGLTQPQVCNLLRGRTEGFSLERLFRCVNALGFDVRVTYAPASQAEGRVQLGVPPSPARLRPRQLAADSEGEERRAA